MVNNVVLRDSACTQHRCADAYLLGVHRAYISVARSPDLVGVLRHGEKLGVTYIFRVAALRGYPLLELP